MQVCLGRYNACKMQEVVMRLLPKETQVIRQVLHNADPQGGYIAQ